MCRVVPGRFVDSVEDEWKVKSFGTSLAIGYSYRNRSRRVSVYGFVYVRITSF